MTTTTPRAAWTTTPASRRNRTGPGYLGAIVTGAVLITVTAINQPYNQNELRQINPYSGDTVEEITGGTRQPPLDPILGALVQHVLGEGQLRQRLVPVLAGIGTLVVLSLLLRRLRLGWAGVYGMWVLATAPIMVCYSAYARPYALPTFLMTVFVFMAHRWLEGQRRLWGSLAVATVAGLALPAARVIEAIIFLATVALVLVYRTFRGGLGWSRTGPLVGSAGACLVLVGYPMYRSLAAKVGGADESLVARAAGRFDNATHELVTGFLPLMASWLPWWPVTVLIFVCAVVVGAARRLLLKWWFFVPLMFPAVAWVLIYHFFSPYPLAEIPYMPRYALLVMPAYALLVVALATAVGALRRRSRALSAGLVLLLAAALLGQLPATATILHEDIAPNYGEAADYLTQRMPDDAIILYDTAAPAGWWHQPWSGKPRYMDNTPYVGQVSSMMRRPRRVPTEGPVFVLMLDSECAGTTLCHEPPANWDEDVPGWHVRARVDRFTLYAPDRPQFARLGVIKAMTDFAKDLGPDLGAGEVFTAASLLKLRGRDEEGRALIRWMYSRAAPAAAERIRENARSKNLDPFARP